MKIGYSKTFPNTSTGEWEKIPLEIDVTPDIDFLTATPEQIQAFMLKVRNIQYALKKQIEAFHYESLNAEKKKEQEIIPQTPTEPQTKIGMFIADIFSCTSLKVLDTYKLLVKGNPELQEAWNMQHATLSGKS